jgi:hypothetical protein
MVESKIQMKRKDQIIMFKEENRKKTIAVITAVLVFVLMLVLAIAERVTHTAHANVEDENLAVITETTSVSTSTPASTSSTTDITASTQITTTTENTTSTSCETSTTTETTPISVTEEEIGEAVEEIVVRELHNVSRTNNNVVEAITVEPMIETIPSETTHGSTTTTNIETTTSVTTTVDDTECVETVAESDEEIALGNFRITGYVSTGNKTASGVWPTVGRTIAMNKSQMKTLGLSYGDTIRIDGLGTYVLEDCGCASGRIDVFCSSVKACYALPSHADAYLVK